MLILIILGVGWYLMVHVTGKRLIEIENEELREMQEFRKRRK